MSQNGSVHKTDRDVVASAGRREFLQALYQNAPDDLFLELRLIHPITKAVKMLWSPVGDKAKLTRIFKQADALNRNEGYGLYFAPCLRNTEQGKVEAVAVVPALWVDIDCGDGIERDRAMERLHGFDPLPSVILDSGGGLHAYWLLDAPFLTPDQAARDEVAVRLRGLFAAVGGDEAYVKTVAGIMRLPESVNTKPERGGVIATLLEFHPDLRYPFTAFDWLMTEEKSNRPAGAASFKRDLGGDRPLPKRTEDYLRTGAAEGQRNRELFAAACQMRDAGYAQLDVESHLVPRYVADGCSKTEAIKTIASVFSRPPRAPLLDDPHGQVAQLVSRYARETESERPSAAQIAEAVRACAALDPIAWAEERQRLKSVCGEGTKLSDLDRLYKEARKQQSKHAAAAVEEKERYVEHDGTMIYERQGERGTAQYPVADWVGQVVESIIHVDDDGQIDHVTRLRVEKGGKQVTLDVPGELFGDPNGLARFIAGRAGGMFSPRAGMHKHLAPAILKLSSEAPERQTYRFMGWTPIDGKWVYLSTGVSVSAAGVLEKAPEVDLEHRLRDYGLQGSLWEDGLAAFNAAIAVFPKALAPALIAFSLLPLVQRFFPSAAPKPALHLVGTTGSGKSEIAALMAGFYGQFNRDTPPAQWGDTVNTVETLGYALADALYWVDDYKTCYADERTFTRFLQSYSREMGRGRLTREAKLRQERPCRGLLLSTGETTLEGEASILSRMLVLEVPPWEQRDPGGKRLAEADRLRAHLPAFTAAFAAWIAAKADAGTLTTDLAGKYEQTSEGYRLKLTDKLGKQANTGRLTRSWAVLLSTFQLLHEFLIERDADDAFPFWQDAIIETVRAVQQERAGQVFLDLLGQLLAGGQCVIDDNLREPREYAPGTSIIGYRDEGVFVYLLPDIVLREIHKMHPLKFTKNAIGAQLREDEVLVPGKDSLTVQKSVRGHVIRLWRLKVEKIGCEGCEPCEAAE